MINPSAFKNDDRKNPELTELCLRFAHTVQRNVRKWLVLWGECGTGKTFMAREIAEFWRSCGASVKFTTISQIERELWNEKDKAWYYDDLFSYDCLILDDFGMERRTDYMNEIAFSVIDGWLRTGKPCIITTNLSKQHFLEPADIGEKRLYSRIFERSIFYEVTGADRRLESLVDGSKRAIAELLDEDPDSIHKPIFTRRNTEVKSIE